MRTSIDAFCLTPNGRTRSSIYIDLPKQCPNCSVAYMDNPLTVYLSSNDNHQPGIEFAYAMFFCPHCGECFYITYVNDIGLPVENSFSIIQQYPIQHVKTPFSNSINHLSPQFVKIYNQAEEAQSQNLTEICGLGYRKALEFLIKDFAISNNPDSVAEIQSSNLSQCINNYIDSEHIKSLAKAATWLGNDESHYLKKHSDYSLDDLKIFIDTAVAFIQYELNYQSALDLLSDTK